MFFAVFLGQHAFPNGRGSGNESAHLAFPDYPPASPRLIPLIAHLLTKDPAARPLRGLASRYAHNRRVP